jgi:hypothetical protein
MQGILVMSILLQELSVSEATRGTPCEQGVCTDYRPFLFFVEMIKVVTEMKESCNQYLDILGNDDGCF